MHYLRSNRYIIKIFQVLFCNMRYGFSIIGCLFLISYIFGADSESLAELKSRADNGEAEAQFIIGIKYEKSEDVGQDYTEAVRWYQKVAELGDVRTQTKPGVDV